MPVLKDKINKPKQNVLVLRLRFKKQGLASNGILSIEFSRHSSKPSDVWNGGFCRYLSEQSPLMGFLLLAFYPSVWSVLKLDVLCCCNQRRSKDSPSAFPWGHLAWAFAREKAPLNTVRLYVFRDEQAASSIQRLSLGKTSLPDSLQFLTHTPTPPAKGGLVTLRGHFSPKEILWQENHIIWIYW